MSFFESIPQPPPPEPVRRHRPAWQRPEDVIPGSVPADMLLARTERVAVAIGSARAYPNGFEFTLHARLRGEDQGPPLVPDPFGRHGMRYGMRYGRPPAEDNLRLGVLYADGRRAATTAGLSDPDDEQLILHHGGSGGSERTWDGDFWVHPLPPDGPVTFVLSWLEYGVTEARAELDGKTIRQAAERSVALWPEDPDDESSGGWTSRTLTASAPGDPATGSESG